MFDIHDFIERPTFQAHPNLLFLGQFYTTKPQERTGIS
jgi:hypothetical protein